MPVLIGAKGPAVLLGNPESCAIVDENAVPCSVNAGKEQGTPASRRLDTTVLLSCYH